MASAPTLLAGQDMPAGLIGVPAWTPMAGSYTSSWSDLGGGNVTGQYRLWQLLNEVEIIGSLSHASISGASAFFTLPVGFRAASSQCVCIWNFGASQLGALTTDSTGALTLNGLSAATSVQFHGWVSLDA